MLSGAVKDKRTAYELRKGRPYKRKLPPFAEAVMYLRVAEKRTRQKFEDRWNTGIYLGLVERSNMVLVGTPNGVVKVNSIKRLPMNQAKDPELLKSIRGYPWRLTPGDVQNEPGEVSTMVASEPVVREDELPPRLPRVREAEVEPRRVYIRRNVELRKKRIHAGLQSLYGCRKLATRPRTTRRRAAGASNLPWRLMMLNERGSRRIDERVRRLEPPDSHELGVLRTSQSVKRPPTTTMQT